MRMLGITKVKTLNNGKYRSRNKTCELCSKVGKSQIYSKKEFATALITLLTFLWLIITLILVNFCLFVSEYI